MGLSPSEYQMNLHLANASSILLHSTQSIGEIAAECGFCDSTHFIKNSRLRYGVTPGQFRKQFWGQSAGRY